jgi:hypothetical protein
LLGDASNIRASKSKQGPFELLRNHPEFRDMVVTAAPLKQPVKEKATPAQGVRTRTPPPAEEEEASPRPSTGRLKSGALPRQLIDRRPPSDEVTNAPLIDLSASARDLPQPKGSWLWIVWFLLAVALTAVAGFFLLPLLFHVR